MNEILELNAAPLPFDLNDKIFCNYDDDGVILGETYSYNDFIKEILDISGINEDLLSSNDQK